LNVNFGDQRFVLSHYNPCFI